MLCPNCNTTFYHSDKRRRFCSNACYRGYRTNHPEEYGLNKTNYTCVYCGKDGIKRKPSESANKVYCSRTCSNRAQSEALRQNPELYTHNGTEIVCENCGSIFHVKPHRAKKARFCSKTCSYAYRFNRPFKQNNRDINGKNNPNYKGNNNSVTARKTATIAFGEKCMICGFDVVVHTHHIVPRRHGGTNEVGNLIVLCPNHHEMADRGLITQEELFTLNPFATAQESESQPQTNQLTMFERPSVYKTL